MYFLVLNISLKVTNFNKGSSNPSVQGISIKSIKSKSSKDLSIDEILSLKLFNDNFFNKLIALFFHHSPE